jgi:parallel beta-helix repeat protein
MSVVISTTTIGGSLEAIWSIPSNGRWMISGGRCAAETGTSVRETATADRASIVLSHGLNTLDSAKNGRRASATVGKTLKWVEIGVAVFLFGGLVPSVTNSADYWVGPHGRDLTGSGGQRRPWATLQFAADRVKAGDTVHVLDGDYIGFYLSRGGENRASIQFIAEGKSVRITSRNRETPDGINIEGAGHIIVEGFVIDEMPRAGIRITHSAHSTIRRIRADRNRNWGIFTSFCDDILIEGNIVSRSIKEHGIYVSNSGDRPIVRGNVSRGNRMCGVHMNGDAGQGGDGIISGALVENNVVFDNGPGGGSGINCDGVQDSKLQNNLLYNNHAYGVSLYRIDGAAGSTGNSVTNNTIVQAADGRWAVNIKNQSTNNLVANNILLHRGSRGSINLSVDSMPGFRSDCNIVVDRLSPDDGDRVLRLSDWRAATGQDRHSLVSKLEAVFGNTESDDYHLRDGSPAVDAADPALAPIRDIEDRARPVGVRPDIGAYEANDGKITRKR